MKGIEIANELRMIRENHSDIYGEMLQVAGNVEACGEADETDVQGIENIIATVQSIEEQLRNLVYMIMSDKIAELEAKVKETEAQKK